MATTRTSSRQAAQKAKEAITSTAEPKGQTSAGVKRKGSAEKAPKPKKEKKETQEPKEEKVEEETKEPVKEEPANGAGKIRSDHNALLLILMGTQDRK